MCVGGNGSGELYENPFPPHDDDVIAKWRQKGVWLGMYVGLAALVT